MATGVDGSSASEHARPATDRDRLVKEGVGCPMDLEYPDLKPSGATWNWREKSCVCLQNCRSQSSARARCVRHALLLATGASCRDGLPRSPTASPAI